MNLINNRELAAIIWLFIFIFCMLFNTSIRKLTFNILKILFSRHIMIMVATLAIYSSITIYLLLKLGLWNISVLKDTIFWFFGTAFVFAVNANKANKEDKYFKNIISDNIKIILILEFIANLYVFNLWIELIIAPLVFVLAAMLAVSERKKEFQSVSMFVTIVLVVFVAATVVFGLYNILYNFKSFATLDNLRSFIFPPLLTFMLLPYIYLLALFMEYEQLFFRLDWKFKGGDALARFTKMKIIKFCLFDLKKLNEFSKKSKIGIVEINNQADILDIIHGFKSGKTDENL